MDKNNNNSVEPITVSLLDELLSRLQADRDSIDAKMAKIQAVKRSLLHQTDSSLAPQPKRTYRRKGANRKAIMELFEANNGLALGIAQIAQRIGIPPSSTSATLKQLQEEGLFEQTDIGVWRKKATERSN